MRLLMRILHIGSVHAIPGLDLEEVEKKVEISRALDIVKLRREFKVMANPGMYAESLYRQFG
jgi:hypothetical protein